MTLTRDEFFARRRPLPKIKVDLPELGDGAEVFVQKFSAKLRDRFECIVTDGVAGRINLDNVRARVVTLLAVNDSGRLLFTEADADRIGDEFDTDTVQRIIDAGFRLNNINTNALEDVAKN